MAGARKHEQYLYDVLQFVYWFKRLSRIGLKSSHPAPICITVFIIIKRRSGIASHTSHLYDGVHHDGYCGYGNSVCPSALVPLMWSASSSMGERGNQTTASSLTGQ